MQLVIRPTVPQDCSKDVAGTHPAVSIAVPQDDLSIEEIMLFLVKPALLACGFDSEAIEPFYSRDSYVGEHRCSCGKGEAA